MAKLLTNREMELFRVAMELLTYAPISNTPEQRAKIVAKKLSFKIDEDDIAEMCESVGGG